MSDIPYQSSVNPFRVTKAYAYSDVQIYETFVQNQRIFDRVTPSSKMPTILTGGKGSGRTHLMRYWSLPVQALRSANSLKDRLAAEGYVGTYVLMGGLNAGRFESLNLADEARTLLFGYYFDLQVASSFLSSVDHLVGAGTIHEEELSSFVQGADALLAGEAEGRPAITTMEDLRGLLASLRRDVDLEINDAVLVGRVPTFSRIPSAPGAIFFGFPQLAGEHFEVCRGLTLTYLLDELENLSESQQTYVQTLIRDRAEPVGIVVAGRTYGIRTFRTLAAGEQNRPGAEFDPVGLDELMRESDKDFAEFASELIYRRLETVHVRPASLADMFEVPEVGRFGEQLQRSDAETVALQSLRRSLGQYRQELGLTARQADQIVRRCRAKGAPLLEKAAILALYSAWSRRRDLVEESSKLAADIRLAQRHGAGRLIRILGHFRADLLAQIRRERRAPQAYLGLESVIRLADGNPRSLLNLMKLMFDWSGFMREPDGTVGRISTKAQQRAVAEASEWFYSDAQVVGPSSDAVRRSVERLGELLESCRFARKPAESSLCAVSIELPLLSKDAASVLQAAEAWSLLVQRPSRRDRNDPRKRRIVQLNRMLAPRWSLPTGRRGVMALSSHEAEAIFGKDEETFEEVLRVRLARLNPPFRRSKKAPENTLSLF